MPAPKTVHCCPFQTLCHGSLAVLLGGCWTAAALASSEAVLPSPIAPSMQAFRCD